MTDRPLIESLTNAGAIFAYLQSLEMAPSQSLGQNFLCDRPLLEALLTATRLEPTDRVVEIGPGLGHLTRVLTPRTASILAIEKDRRLSETLMDRLGDPPNLTLWNEDILETETEMLDRWREREKLVFIGNLPYYCSSQILGRVFEDWLHLWKRCGFLLQEEVVDRLVAPPGTKTYGRLSVLVQLYSQPRKVRKVSPHLFVPKPEVTSAWVVFDSLEAPPSIPASEIARLTGVCFGERRKTLQNNLARELGKEAAGDLLARAGIDGARRAESLSPKEFLNLAAHFCTA